MLSKLNIILFGLLIISNQLLAEKETQAQEVSDLIISSFEKNNAVEFSKLFIKGAPIHLTTGFKEEDFAFRDPEKEFPKSSLFRLLFDINYKETYMVDESLYSFRKAFLNQAKNLEKYFPKNERAQLKVRYERIDYVIYLDCTENKKCKIIGFFREYGGE